MQEGEVSQEKGEDADEPLAFHEMGLDDRIQKAIAKLGWSQPTLIQEKAIPLILDGKDVLAKGRTGSGNFIFHTNFFKVFRFLESFTFKL